MPLGLLARPTLGTAGRNRVFRRGSAQPQGPGRVSGHENDLALDALLELPVGLPGLLEDNMDTILGNRAAAEATCA